MKRFEKKETIVAGALATLMLVGGTFAYFTDHHETTNKFTVGNITTTLTEPNWDTTDANQDGVPDTAENLVPGKVTKKDPTVTNVGKNSAYVFLEVKVPMANIITANTDGTKNTAAFTELYSYTTNTGWTQMSKTVATDKLSVTYVYAYNNAIDPNAKTTPLFDNVTFVNAIEGQGLENKSQQIEVKEKAIQKEGSANYTEAYAKYVAQNS